MGLKCSVTSIWHYKTPPLTVPGAASIVPLKIAGQNETRIPGGFLPHPKYSQCYYFVNNDISKSINARDFFLELRLYLSVIFFLAFSNVVFLRHYYRTFVIISAVYFVNICAFRSLVLFKRPFRK